jgi:hypothetical protein
MKRSFLSIAALSAVAVSHAFSTVGPFVGNISEGFESQPTYVDNGYTGVSSMSIMGGQATLSATYTAFWVGQAYQWGLGGNGGAVANSGSNYLGLFNNSTTSVDLIFDQATTDFGAYFATCSSDYGPLYVAFYDENDFLVGTDSFVADGGNGYNWHGWSHSTGIKKVTFVGNAAPVLDDLQAYGQAVPEPTTMAALAIGAVAMLRRRRSAR